MFPTLSDIEGNCPVDLCAFKVMFEAENTQNNVCA